MRPAVAATQFTAYMALMNLGTTAAQASAGWGESLLGLTGIWLLGAGIQAIAAILMPLTIVEKPASAPAEV